MGSFAKVTRTSDSEWGVIWISKYQIIYLESDERQERTTIYCQNNEIKVEETVAEILKQFDN